MTECVPGASSRTTVSAAHPSAVPLMQPRTCPFPVPAAHCCPLRTVSCGHEFQTLHIWGTVASWTSRSLTPRNPRRAAPCCPERPLSEGGTPLPGPWADACASSLSTSANLVSECLRLLSRLGPPLSDQLSSFTSLHGNVLQRNSRSSLCVHQ